MEQAIDHDALDDVLRSCGSSWSAGQVHGLLCGRLVVIGADGASQWFAQVLEGTDADHARRGECEQALDALFSTTWQQLVERQSEFTLVLPDDQESVETRTAAMTHWCEGFLHGLVSEKHSDDLKKRLAAEPLADIIKDILQITQAAIGEEEDVEAAESALTELVEYLRVAAQLTYEELADCRTTTETSTTGKPGTLH